MITDTSIKPKCILAGVDTLELGVCVEEYLFSEDQWSFLECAKENARSTPFNNDLGSVTFQGKDFIVNRAGAQRYGYILSNDDVMLRINDKAQGGKYFPEVKVIFRSAYLWRNGWQCAVKDVMEWLAGWLILNRIIVSRCDITADFNAPLPILDTELRQVVTRAVNKRNYMKDAMEYGRFTIGKKISGYVFGGKKLHCRIYDKVLEIARSNKKWLYILWEKNGWHQGDPVTRVEFQCRREYLRSMQTDTVQDLIFQIADLWHNLTQEWLTIREIGQDSHRSRWEMTEFWKLVQNSLDSFGKKTGIVRLKQQRPTYQRVNKQLRGHLVSLHALLMSSLKGSNYKIVHLQIQNLLLHLTKDKTFEADVKRRIARYSSMDS